jgi:hypothetical protein
MSDRDGGKIDSRYPNVLVNVNLEVVAERSFVSPPLSSKVIKFFVDRGVFGDVVKRLSSSRDKYKPFFISNLRYVDDVRRIYSVGRGGVYNPPVILSGRRLVGRISFVSSHDVINDVLSVKPSSIYDLEFGSERIPLRIIVKDVEVVGEIDSLSIDLSDKILIRFHTPVVLSPKIMIPPSLAEKPKYKKIPVSNLLLPMPGALIGYSMKLWNNIMPPEKRFTYPNDEDSLYIFKTSLLANIFTEIIDYKIRPVTMAVGRDEHGKLRETRGFIGYIIIKINHPKIRRIAEKTLALANHLGIGRGRGIGLGEIEITKIK